MRGRFQLPLLGCLVALLSMQGVARSAFSQSGDRSPAAVAGAPAAEYTLLARTTIEARLQAAPRTNSDREKILDQMFEASGCKGADLAEQPVKHERLPNVVCTLKGRTESTIIIGAHFDKVNRGEGVADNWSGASVLPSLFEGLHDRPRNHTFIFVGFTSEEEGLIGSKFYVKQMTPEQAAETRAMINLDTLGLGPTKVWLNHSSMKLAEAFFAVAQSLKLPVAVVNADNVGEDDSESFIRHKIPTLMIHSITQETLHILHSNDDNFSSIQFGDYYDTYRLLTAYLASIDTTLQ